jgi:hypothetical protein
MTQKTRTTTTAASTQSNSIHPYTSFLDMFIADNTTSDHKLAMTAAAADHQHHHHAAAAAVDKNKRTVRHDYHDHANDAPIGVPASISDTSLNRHDAAVVTPTTLLMQQHQELIDETEEEANKKRRGPRGGVAVPFPGTFEI